MKQEVGYRIWIEGNDGTFLGRGRISLLEQIEHTGSISKAAKTLKMSYKKAWNLVDSMNKELGEDLVNCTSGGSGGGGTQLTQRGRNAIKNFKTLEAKMKAFAESEFSQIEF